jgi:hypothetical protein
MFIWPKQIASNMRAGIRTGVIRSLFAVGEWVIGNSILCAESLIGLRHFAKILVLDTLGCMLSGSVQDSNNAALHFTRAMGGSPDSSVVNYGDKTSPFNAAFLNASFSHGWEFDDMINAGAAHAVSAAATLALAEKELINGRDSEKIRNNKLPGGYL